MHNLIALIFFIILLQDIKFRAVHWISFPVLLGLCIYYKLEIISWTQIGWSLIFLTILLLSLTIYLTIKEQRFIKITQGYFSLGDILFLIAVIPLFDVKTFMLFFIVGTIFTLIVHLLISLFTLQKTIPYAGYMSLVGIAYLFLEQRIHQITNYL